MELISSLSEFLTQRRRGAEARNRPLRAPTTHGEVGRPSERECRESFMAAARQGTPQRGSGGWPPDIKPCLCVTMKSVLNAKPPLTASAHSASLR